MPNAPSLYVIAAMCGNFSGESTVNPQIWESLTPTSWDHQYAYDNIGGYGLGQWTNVGTPYGRCWNLHVWVTTNGFTDGDGYGQLAFLIHEDYWTPTSITPSAYPNLTAFLESSSTDIDALTAEYMFHWEGINNASLSTRQQNAHTFYSYIEAHFNDPTITDWVAGNRYLSMAEMCNNAVLIARYLTSGVLPSHWPFIFYKKHLMRKKRRCSG